MNGNDPLAQVLPRAQRLERAVSAGATILVLPEPRLPVVRFCVGFRRGAAGDPMGKAGRSHAMLELLLRGTRDKSRAHWNTQFERLGSQLNVSLTSDFGVIHGLSLKHKLDATLALVREALFTPAFAESERSPLIEEISEQLVSERDDDDALLDLFWRRSLYRRHPFSRRPSGEPDDLESIGRDDILSAYSEHLVSENLVIAFAGDITLAEAETAASYIVEGARRGGDAHLSVPAFHAPNTVDILLVDKPERTQAQLCVGCLTVPGSHEDSTALQLGAEAFGGIFTSPFTREVRDIRGWSYIAHADLPSRRRFATPLSLRSAPASSNLVDCLELELGLYRTFAGGQLRSEDIEFAQSYLLNQYPMKVASAADLMIPALRNEFLGLPPDELFRLPERIAALSCPVVLEALARHFSPAGVIAVAVVTVADVLQPLQDRFPEATIRVVDFRDDVAASFFS